MPARGYEFCLRVLNAISHELAQRYCYFLILSGQAKIHSTDLKLNDNKWHKVQVTRHNKNVSIIIDNGVAHRRSLIVLQN